MAMTSTEAHVAPDRHESLRQTFGERTSNPSRELGQVPLVQSSNDPTLWRTTGLWLVTAKSHKPVLENARVRVFNVTFAPGARVAWHGHPDHVVSALTDARLRFKLPDGRTRDIAPRAGETLWIQAGPHETINMGPKEARLLVVELK
jgi:beta-alanine degradation protein BauB